ncbi:hypothetical protein GF373_15470 [bacterium]|nr:hypothetical protein [bacterium]
MGLNYIAGKTIGSSGKQEYVRFLVDSGASYSLWPDAWEILGLVLNPLNRILQPMRMLLK